MSSSKIVAGWIAPASKRLLGREDELNLLHSAWREAVQGKGQTWFVTGSPGHGKNILLQTLVSELYYSSFLSLTLSFWSPEKLADPEHIGKYRHDPRWAEALAAWEQPLKARLPKSWDRAGLPWRAFISQLVAASSDKLDLLPYAPKDDPLEVTFTLLERAAQTSPLLLVIENLDQDETFWRGFIECWGREILGKLPVLMLVSFNTPYPLCQPPLSHVTADVGTRKLEQLCAQEIVHEIFLDNLTVEQLSRVLDHAPGGLAGYLVEITGGVPSLIELWLEVWMEDSWAEYRANLNRWKVYDGVNLDTIPESIENWVTSSLQETMDRILEQTDWLPDALEGVFKCAAIEGVKFTVEAMSEVLNLERDNLQALLDGWLTSNEDHPQNWFVKLGNMPGVKHEPGLLLYAFQIPLLREGIIQGVTTAEERKAWGRSLGLFLEPYYEAGTDETASKLARLFTWGELPEKALQYKTELEPGSLPENLQRLNRKIELAHKNAYSIDDFFNLFYAQEELATKLLQSGRYNQALTMAKHALQSTQRLNSQPHQARALFLVGKCYYYLNQLEQSLMYYQSALLIIQARRDLTGEADILSSIGQSYYAMEHIKEAEIYFSQALHHYQELLSRAQALGDKSMVAMLLTNMGQIFHTTGNLEQALIHYTEALPLLELAHMPQLKGVQAELVMLRRKLDTQ
jgi:tetratricopeptide (TPR) repeat protein